MAIQRAHCSEATVLPTPGQPPTSTRSWARMPPPRTSSSGSNPVGNCVARARGADGPTPSRSSAAVAMAMLLRGVITSLTSASEAGLRDADDGRTGHDHEERGKDAEHNGEDDLHGELHRPLLRLHLPLVAHLGGLHAQDLRDRDAVAL